MKDENKTKKQLIEELAEMRRQHADCANNLYRLQKAEKELSESQNRYRSIVESFDVAVCRWLPDTTLTYVNDQYCRIFGVSKDQAVNTLWLDLVPEKERNAVAQLYRNLAEQPRKFSYEHKVVTKDGKIHWFFWIDVPIFDDGGRLLEFQSVGHDITEQKLATTALAESEKKFRTLMGSTAAAIYLIQDNNFVYINPAFEKLTGYTLAELAHIPFWNFIHPDFREMVKEKGIRRQQGDEPPERYEFKIIIKNGKEKWVELSAASLTIQNNKLTIMGSMFDITERKHTEEALRLSEDKFRALAESTSTIIFLIQNEKFTYINPAFQRDTGYNMEDLASMKFWDFIHPDHRELVKTRGLQRLQGASLPSRYEIKIVAKDGQVKWADFSATVAILDGKMTIIGSVFDITEQKFNEAALKESEAKYRSILENIIDGYFEVDLQGNLTFFNNVLTTATGYTPNELQGMNYRIFIDSDNRKIIRPVLTELYENITPAKVVSYEIIKKDGTKTYIETMFSAIRDNAGHIVGFRGISRDITEQKKAEEALRRNEEILRSVFNAAPVGLCIMKDRIFQNANKAWYELFGYSASEIIGQTPRMLYKSEEEYERIGRELYDNVRKRGRTSVETRLRRKDGVFRNVILTSIPLPLEDNFTRSVVAIEDITERKLAEDELKRSEYLYRAIFENTGNANLLLSPDTKILLVNSEFEKLSGYSREEIEGKKSWTEFIAPYDLPRMLQYNRQRRADAGSAPRKYEFQFVDRNGRVTDMDISVDMIPDTKESIVSLHDMTIHKQAERTLQESQQRLTDIIDFLPDATLIIDKEGKVIAWNRAMETMTGVKKEAMLGCGNREHALPFYGERKPILIDLALNPDPALERQYTAIQRIGDILFGEAFTPNLPRGNAHLAGTASILRDKNGEVIAAIECIRDNTERKKLEERLNRAEKMETLGKLAGGVAHDLNNILGVLVGYSELLGEGLPEESPLKKYTNGILQSSMKSAAIIQDLLTLARRGVAVSEIVNLNKTVRDYLRTPEFEKLQSHHPHVHIYTDLAENLLPIKGSPVHLGKTIMNLVSNAAEAISDRGEVWIKTESRHLDRPIREYEEIQEGDYVVLTVSDTGLGISTYDQDKIFEPFYTKKTMGRSGTGLGLAVVWGTVKDHQGYIDVQSEESKGSTFTLYFPATKETAVTITKAQSLATYRGKGESILVVDDVSEQRELAMSMLARLGYKVAAVSGGEKAVEYLKNKKADLIVLDMIMDPGIDGMETYRRILEIVPGQKAIIVSGFSETDRVKNTQEMGAGEFVRKPYILEKIGLAVRNELDRK